MSRRSLCSFTSALLLALAFAACAPPVAIPDAERERASRELTGARVQLKVAAYLVPLFDDASKFFLSDQPIEELDLLRTPGGDITLPPPPERVLVPGTSLTVQKVEFPTGWTIASRVIGSPRYHPWVYLSLPGEERPVLVVLPQLIDSAEGARAELERLVGARDVASVYRALPETQQAAIARKELARGMSATAAEMAWGYPARKVIDRPAESETWTWPEGRRRAWFERGRLTRWENRLPPAP